MMPELYLADALGATGKPLLRVHTAGSVGGSTGIVAASLVQAGMHRRVLAVAFEKQSESNAMWALSIPPPFSMPVLRRGGRVLRAAHPRLHPPQRRARRTSARMVAVKDRRNGACNPYAHLQQPDITLEKVLASPMLWDPVRYDETCPSSDGACAVVHRRRGGGRGAASDGQPVAWIRATAMRTEPTMFAGKDQVNPQAGRDAAAALWQARRDHQPDRRDRRRRDLRAVLLVRADVAGEPRLRRAGRGLAAHRGRRDRDRRARCRSTRPAGCSAPTRSARPACCGSPRRRMQVMGKAGRAPGGRGPDRARPRLRRRLAVLLDVGGRRHPGLTGLQR